MKHKTSMKNNKYATQAFVIGIISFILSIIFTILGSAIGIIGIIIGVKGYKYSKINDGLGRRRSMIGLLGSGLSILFPVGLIMHYLLRLF